MNNTTEVSSNRSTLSHLSAPILGGETDLEKRTCRAAQTLTPRREKPFPIADFKEAISKVNISKVKQILIDYGVAKQDVDFIEIKFGLLKDQKNLKETLTEVLFSYAIVNSMLAYLPALSHNQLNEKVIQGLMEVAGNVFCEKRTQDSFEIFRLIVQKFGLPKAAVESCLKKTYNKIKDNVLLASQMRKSFGKYDFTNRPADHDLKEDVIPPPKIFPAHQFRMALGGLHFEELSKILKSHGWDKADLEMTGKYMNQLQKEGNDLTRKLTVDCNALNSLDEICYQLLIAGIDKECPVLSILPFLPDFDSFHRDRYIAQLADFTIDCLSINPTDGMFKILGGILERYQPQMTEQMAKKIATCRSKSEF